MAELQDYREAAEYEAPTKQAKVDKKALVGTVRDALQEAYEHDRQNREEANTDLEFLAGNQWPDSVKSQREGRPMLTINRLPQFVRQITNDVRQADMAIKVAPEDDDSDPELAEIYDDLIRQIQYRSSAKHVYSQAAEHQAGCSIGWFRVTTAYADDMSFNQEIKIKGIADPLSVYADPGSIEPDRSDAMWIAVTERVPKKTFKRRYPKASESGVDIPNDGSSAFSWASDDSVSIAEYWYKVPVVKTLGLTADGQTLDLTTMQPDIVKLLGVVQTRPCHTHKIEMAIVSGTEVLEGPFSWPGKYIPLIPVIGGEFPLGGKLYRYSAIRFARDPQQIYNYARSAFAETIANAPKAPYVATADQIKDFKGMWDTAHTKNRPYLLYGHDPQAPGPPKREHPPEMPTAFMQEALTAEGDMKATVGIYDAALGAKSNETSGIAIGRRQAESDVANYHFVDNLHRSLEHCGRILIDLIPKVYDNERVMRLRGEDGEERSVTINKTTYAENGMPVMVNDLSAAAFDVRVTVGRGYATKRAETADAMIEFMKAIPQSGPVLADLIAKALDFPDSDMIAERLKKMAQQQGMIEPDEDTPPPPDPLADPMVRVELENKHADTRKKLADARKVEIETAMLTAPAPPMLSPEPPVPPVESFALPQQAPMPPPGGMAPEDMQGLPPDMGPMPPDQFGPQGPIPPDMGASMPPA